MPGDESETTARSTDTTEIRVLIDSPIDDGVVESIDEALGEIFKSDSYVIADDDGRVELDEVIGLLENHDRRGVVGDA